MHWLRGLKSHKGTRYINTRKGADKDGAEIQGISSQKDEDIWRTSKRYWNNRLTTSSDLEKLALDVKSTLGFSDDDLPFIKEHIRIAMGLDPRGDKAFENELDLVRKSKSVGLPVVSRIGLVCENCNNETCRCHLIV